jgi:hypothetical protein
VLDIELLFSISENVDICVGFASFMTRSTCEGLRKVGEFDLSLRVRVLVFSRMLRATFGGIPLGLGGKGEGV